MAKKKVTSWIDWGEKDAEVAKVETEAHFTTTDTGLDHLSKRVDELELLVKRIHDHLSQFHRI